MPTPFRPLMDRFLEKFRVDSQTKCWVWTGSIKPNGYGQIGEGWPSKKNLYAHRAAYLLFRGEIPDGLHIDHLCRNRACVNPAHLEAVTAQENNGRVPKPDHCPRGHPYTPKNTGRQRQRGDGWSRYCRACNREKNRDWRENRGGAAWAREYERKRYERIKAARLGHESGQ